MLATLANVLVLEVSTRKTKSGTTYNNLIVYEFGKDYPEALALRINDGLLDSAKSIVGKKVSVNVNVNQMRGDNGPYVTYSFAGVAV